jgi:hypothetical protein
MYFKLEGLPGTSQESNALQSGSNVRRLKKGSSIGAAKIAWQVALAARKVASAAGVSFLFARVSLC